MIALIRGEKLREDASGSGGAQGLMLFILRIFDYLFERFNVDNSPFGWQLMMIAENPSEKTGSF